MTSKEFDIILSKTPKSCNLYVLNEEQKNEIKKDLEMLEELKNPYDDYENENYMCKRQAYYNENLGELNYGYAVYKWDGTYREINNKYVKKPIKLKNWVEIYHAGTTTSKRELNDKYIQDILDLIDALHLKEEDE